MSHHEDELDDVALKETFDRRKIEHNQVSANLIERIRTAKSLSYNRAPKIWNSLLDVLEEGSIRLYPGVLGDKLCLLVVEALSLIREELASGVSDQ